MPPALLRFSSPFLGGGHERRGEFLVEREEVFDALAVVLERLRAVAEVNGVVEVGMGFDQRGRHRQRVVEIGHRRAGEFLACVQHGLRGCFHGGEPRHDISRLIPAPVSQGLPPVG